MSRDVEFGREIKRQKIERWRHAVSDYGYPFEIVPGYEAMAALEAAQLTSAKRAVTPIIVPPGNWNSKAIDPGTRCRTAGAPSGSGGSRGR